MRAHLAAHVQEAGALARLGVERPEPVPDVDEARAVRDDAAVGALVVGDAGVAQLWIQNSMLK